MPMFKTGEYIRENFITVARLQNGKVELTYLNNLVPMGQPGWASSVELSPEQAKEIGEALIKESKQTQST